jgi:hypothetical protein
MVGFAHVLLWFAAVAFDVIKMAEIMPPVYRENLFSVDFEENTMFAGVKQGSLRNELGVKLGPRAHIDGAVVDAAVDHHGPPDLAQAQLGALCDNLDHEARLGTAGILHGQLV